MKKQLAMWLALVFMAPAAPAADGEKKPQEKGGGNVNRGDLIKKYDKNGDGKIDQEERDAIRKERQAEMLKKYDKNGDGKLDDEERAAAREEFRKSRENQRQPQDKKPKK